MSAPRYPYPPRLREALNEVYGQREIAPLYEAFGGATARVFLDQAPTRSGTTSSRACRRTG